ncbi:uncharacterized protein LOC144436888 [Glandiceps talaboti]
MGSVVFWMIEVANNPHNETHHDQQRRNALNKMVMTISSNNYNVNVVNLSMELERWIKEYNEISRGDPDYRWEFYSGYELALSTITTIGYGRIAPRSKEGQAFTMVYSIIGIPIFLMFLGNIGGCVAIQIRKIARKVLLYRARQALLKSILMERMAVSTQLNGSIALLGANWVMKERDDHKHSMEYEDETLGINRNVELEDERYTPGVFRISNFRQQQCTMGLMDIAPRVTKMENVGQVQTQTEEVTTRSYQNNTRRESATNTSKHIYGDIPVCPHCGKEECEAEEALAFVTSIFVFISYVFLSSVLVWLTEPDWTYFECIYFCVISITTIGFGDYTLHEADQEFMRYLKTIVCGILLVMGLVIVSAMFNTAQNGMRIVGTCISRFIKELLHEVESQHEKKDIV